MPPFNRLIRFIPKGQSRPVIGEPVDPSLDIGLALYNGCRAEVAVFSGSSVLDPGNRTGVVEVVDRLLSPLAASEIGTIRCIGLNYTQHAKEVKMPIPTLPTLFLKPATSLTGPWPAPIILPRAFKNDQAGDYESEMAVVLGKDAKNVTEEEAMDYVLGYTAANDVSSRIQQFAQTQWSFSKSFDTACPLGPVLIHRDEVPRGENMYIKGIYNGEVVQDCSLSDLIFSVPKIISFLSQGTTLPAGTVILTGTPAGVGWSAQPRRVLKAGDQFRVNISHGVGTLINDVVEESKL